MNKKNRSHSIDTLFVLTLFCVFAVAVLMSLMMGTRSYSAISAGSDETYYRRTAISYLTEKVHHSDMAQSVYLSEFCGMPALELREEFDGVSYSTYIYLYDDSICELFCETGLDLPEDAGTPIIGCSLLQFEKRDGLLKITYGDPSGREGGIFIALRSKGAIG